MPHFDHNPGKMESTKTGISRLAVAITIIFSIFLTTSIGLYVLGQSTSHIQVSTEASATVRSIEDYGPQISLQQAQGLSGASTLQLPSYLPDNLSLYQMRGKPLLVVIVYQSPALPTVSGYNAGSLIIFVANDSTSYYLPSGQVVVKSAVPSCSSYTNGSSTCSTATYDETISEQSPTQFAVSGHSAWGLTYQGTSLSFLTWWGGGIHYSVTANLPLAVLVKIAESMNT